MGRGPELADTLREGRSIVAGVKGYILEPEALFMVTGKAGEGLPLRFTRRRAFGSRLRS